MADPVSLISFVAGLASLGLQVCDGIRTYIDALKWRDEDIVSVRRQNDVLNQVLQVVKRSLSRLPEHQASTAAVLACFQLCETELQTLQGLVTKLADCDTCKASLGERIRDQNKRLSYAFDRPKLQQLERRLTQANETLGLALLVLGM